jgi:hypothetical protein
MSPRTNDFTGSLIEDIQQIVRDDLRRALGGPRLEAKA